jgi:desulfoferrodoxin (superoxide reductase-like protein)
LNRKALFLIAIPLLLGIAVSVSVQVPTVEALVPSIESVSFHDEGSTTVLNITVFHAGSPTPIGSGHYVSNIQLEINGTVIDLPQSPQSTETFTVRYSLGSNTDTYTVRARALCNLHGYSAQSGIVTVPESMSIVLFIALTTFTVIVTKKTLSRRANT